MNMRKQTFVCAILFLVTIGMVFADDLVMFNYQGRVRVQGTAFNGTGYFKFAIVNNAGNVTLWSNDGTSVGGGEPVASIAVDVVEGIFNVMIGDPDLGMEPINRSIFNHPNQIKLRIWFSDGTHGFQQLLPDRRIVNPQLIGLVSGTEDFTIYVNGATGNDDNNGLTTDTAKRTIQAAVDVLPERLRCNVTIDIANGVYREEVKVTGITVEPGKCLAIVGDENWSPSSGDPLVRITGTDSDTTPSYARDYAFVAEKCTGVTLKGIQADNANAAGIRLFDGIYRVISCKAADNGYNGIHVGLNARAHLEECLAERNLWYGIVARENCSVTLQSCISKDNGHSGVFIDVLSYAIFTVLGEYSGNGVSGIYVGAISRVWFYDNYSGQIRDNGSYGLWVRYDSHSSEHYRNTFLNNAVINTYTDHGGHLY
jgi:hypothetical protein